MSLTESLRSMLFSMSKPTPLPQKLPIQQLVGNYKKEKIEANLCPY